MLIQQFAGSKPIITTGNGSSRLTSILVGWSSHYKYLRSLANLFQTAIKVSLTKTTIKMLEFVEKEDRDAKARKC